MLTIYKASAGSGKTYTLALEYIKILLGVKDRYTGRYSLNHPDFTAPRKPMPDRHRGILAVTFTNKATAEMKTRIIKELADLTRMPQPGNSDANYAKALMGEFGCTRQQLAEAAQSALMGLLNDYGDFNVSTIDAFFQTVLRTFAREVDCRGDYEVELNDEFAVTSGVAMMLDEINYGSPANRARIVKWISDLTFEKINEGKQFNVFNRSAHLLNDLAAFASKITNESFKKYADRTIEYLQSDKPQKFHKALREKLKELVLARKLYLENITDALESHGATPEILNGSLRNLLSDVATDATPSAIHRRLSSMALGNIISLGSDADDKNFFTKKMLPKDSKALVEELKPVIAENVSDLDSNVKLSSILTQIKNAAVSLEFLGYLMEYIDRFRRENNLILLSDTSDLIQRIINGSDTPFIYERMGMRLTNFLIDEFQDTSQLQWENMRPLLANSLASGHDSLIIGDEKQSIYRWRNSDSSLLHHRVANEDFPEKNTLRGTAPGENTNHRSAHAVVQFNNMLFSKLGSSMGIDSYDNVEQEVPEHTAGLTGHVCITDISKSAKEGDADDWFGATARTILKQHEAGYRWSDIAVLVCQNSEGAEFMSYLMANYPEIPFSSDEALLLTNSPSVRLVISMLKLLDYSYAEGRKEVEADGSPHYGTYDESLAMMSRYEYYLCRFGDRTPDGSEALMAALNDSDDMAEMIRREINDVRMAHPTNLVSLVETIVGLKIDPERRKAEMPYIAALVDNVVEYCRMYNPSLSAFIKWWDENSPKLTLLADTEADAVNVLTVHKAKGLEWPCVHVPIMNWKLTREPSMWFEMDDMESISPGAWPPALFLGAGWDMEALPRLNAQRNADKEQQRSDALNILYVAFTRAGRELHVFVHGTGASEKSKGLPDLLIDALGTDKYVIGEPTMPEAGKESPVETRRYDNPEYSVINHPDTEALAHIEDATSPRATIQLVERFDLGNEVGNDPVDALTEAGKDNEAASVRSERTRRGIWLHAVLASMPTLSQFGNAFAATTTHHPLPDEVADEYRKVLAKAFDSIPEWRDRWFVDHVRALDEQSIYDPERRETYRPDRIIEAADGSIEVIDYKFTSEERPEHLDQVRRYMSLLRHMGYDRVNGYLWYPEKGSVVCVK